MPMIVIKRRLSTEYDPAEGQVTWHFLSQERGLSPLFGEAKEGGDLQPVGHTIFALVGHVFSI